MKYGFLLVVSCALIFPAMAADAPAQVTTPPPMGYWQQNYWMWRAFSRLTPAERRNFKLLQRTKPDQFQAELQKRGLALRKNFYQQKNEVRQLIEKYQQASPAEKKALQQQLLQIEKNDFERRVNELSQQIAITRARVNRMQQELDKRRAHAEEIIQVRVDAMLKGEIKWPYLRPVESPKKTK